MGRFESRSSVAMEPDTETNGRTVAARAGALTKPIRSSIAVAALLVTCVLPWAGFLSYGHDHERLDGHDHDWHICCLRDHSPLTTTTAPAGRGAVRRMPPRPCVAGAAAWRPLSTTPAADTCVTPPSRRPGRSLASTGASSVRIVEIGWNLGRRTRAATVEEVFHVFSSPRSRRRHCLECLGHHRTADPGPAFGIDETDRVRESSWAGTRRAATSALSPLAGVGFIVSGESGACSDCAGADRDDPRLECRSNFRTGHRECHRAVVYDRFTGRRIHVHNRRHLSGYAELRRRLHGHGLGGSEHLLQQPIQPAGLERLLADRAKRTHR